MKQEREAPPPWPLGLSRLTPYNYTPSSIEEKVVQSIETDVKQESSSLAPDKEPKAIYTTSKLTPYVSRPASVHQQPYPSPTPDIKQESPSDSPERKVKQESSRPSRLSSLTLTDDTLLGDVQQEGSVVSKSLPRGTRESSTSSSATPDSTPEPDDNNEHMIDSMAAQPLVDAEILRSYGPATKRLLLFDYDGTLTDIVTNPDTAVLSPTVLLSIKSLAEDRKNAVWIISGRDQIFLAKQFGNVSAMGLVAEHGAFIRYPGNHTWLNLTEQVDMSWKEDVLVACLHSMRRMTGSRIETKRAAVVWHYREADPRDAANEARELKTRLTRICAGNWPVEVIEGKCVIEARLDFINKGAIVQKLLNEFNIQNDKFPDFVLCIGDDVTDEGMPTSFSQRNISQLLCADMFRTLNMAHKDVNPDNMFAVTVGKERLHVTQAAWYLLEPRNVIENIMMLNQADLTNDVASNGSLKYDGVTHRGSNPLPIPRSYLL